MCGYRCDLCKAFAGNIKKNDHRQQLSEMMKGDSFCEKEYYEFILAYDNKSRLEGLIKFIHTK